MPYEVRVSHISEDFTISEEHSEVWSRRIEADEDLKLLLNRLAIATTQYPVVEFPEVEITRESRRVLVRAISGKLYYTDLGSSHRKDLVVIPEEIVRLLEGQSVEQALFREAEEEIYVRPSSGGVTGSKAYKTALLLFCWVVFVVAMAYSWKSVSQQPRLVEPPRFVPVMKHQGELLRQYADVYISELREGARVIELTAEGQFSLFELWYVPKRKNYLLMQVASFPVSAGLNQGEPALLAGEIYLLKFQGENLSLHDITYVRYGKKLSTLGEVLTGDFKDARSSAR